MNADELKSRCKTVAIEVAKLVEQLPNGQTTSVFGRQLLRSAASVAANYRSACRARSRAGFINMLGIVEEETDESPFWLEMLVEMKKIEASSVEPLVKELKELLAIFTASRKTAKSGAKQ
ncbi:MAG: four helix bundle protein [Ignavibacteria bacterium]|nr:four helix bundle protein [Ignavibacteria bacterium]